MPSPYRGLTIAVVLPCYNEATAIASVVAAFRAALPEARIYVFDNRSTDGSAELACKAGARVLKVDMRGKGNVVRRMFADVEADIYVMADSDGTYDAGAARTRRGPCRTGWRRNNSTGRTQLPDTVRRCRSYSRRGLGHVPGP